MLTIEKLLHARACSGRCEAAIAWSRILVTTTVDLGLSQIPAPILCALPLYLSPVVMSSMLSRVMFTVICKKDCRPRLHDSLFAPV